MSTGKRLLPVVAITGSSIMVGCGGNSGSSCGYGSYGSFGVANADPRAHRVARAGSVHAASTKQQQYYPGCSAPPSLGADGIYEGTLTDQTTQQVTSVVAIIADNGDGRMSSQDGTYYRLNVATTSGTNVSGDFSGYSHGASFPNGNETTAGTLSAQITFAGLSGTLTDQAGNVEALALTFDNTYTLASALPTLTGSWNYSVSGFSLTATINPDGTFSALDSNGCSYSGSFGIVDPNFNAYSENYMRTCSGSSLAFTGLASYFPPTGSSGAEIKMLADDNAGDYLAADLK